VYDLLDRRSDEYYAEKLRKQQADAKAAKTLIEHDQDPLNGGAMTPEAGT